ncbi:hypothetical protein BGX26_007649, partial [Mortierella sp. AD094]
SPLVRRSSHLGKRRRDHDEELNLVIVHVEHLQQLAMQSSGLDNNVVNIFHNTATESIKSDTSVKLRAILSGETFQAIHQNTTQMQHRSISALYLVQTFKAYQRRLIGEALKQLHDTRLSLLYNPLVRTTYDPDVAIGAGRIRNNIKAVMSKLILPEGVRVLKARAASAEAAK